MGTTDLVLFFYFLNVHNIYTIYLEGLTAELIKKYMNVKTFFLRARLNFLMQFFHKIKQCSKFNTQNTFQNNRHMILLLHHV